MCVYVSGYNMTLCANDRVRLLPGNTTECNALTVPSSTAFSSSPLIYDVVATCSNDTSTVASQLHSLEVLSSFAMRSVALRIGLLWVPIVLLALFGARRSMRAMLISRPFSIQVNVEVVVPFVALSAATPPRSVASRVSRGLCGFSVAGGIADAIECVAVAGLN